MSQPFTRAQRPRLFPLALVLMIVSLAAPAAASGMSMERSVRDVLAGTMASGVELWDLPRWREPLLRLYETRQFVPLWSIGRELTPAASTLIEELRRIETRGLRPEDYDPAFLASLAAGLSANASAGAEQIASLDVAESAQRVPA